MFCCCVFVQQEGRGKAFGLVFSEFHLISSSRGRMEGCGAFVGGNLTWTDPETCSSICRRRVVVSAGLGSIWENIQKAVVRVGEVVKRRR